MIVSEMINSRSLAIFMLCWMCAPIVCAHQSATSDQYLQYEKSARRALVVGNSEYEYHPVLPGVKLDVTEVIKKLKELNFKVSKSENHPTSEGFQKTTLREFRRGINEGDLIVVYLSGHGFSWGGFNYFAGTQMPLTMQASQIRKYATPILNIAEYLGEHEPGGLLIIVDACRNIGDFIEKDKRIRRNKGMAPPSESFRFSKTNYSIAWAQRYGFSAFAEDDEPSVYTRHLLANVNSPDRLGGMLRDVKVAVEIETNDEQSPGITDWSWVDIYFNITEAIEDQQKEKWKAALDTRDPETIRRWVRRNALNPYVKSAKRWLADYESSTTRLTSFTRTSPWEIAEAWIVNEHPQSSINVLALSESIPLVLERNRRFTCTDCLASISWDREAYEKTLEEARSANMPTDELERSMIEATLLASSGTAIITDASALYANPYSDSVPTSDFYVGDRVSVANINPQFDTQRVWVELRNERLQRAFVEIASSEEPIRSIQLGRAIAEFNIAPNKHGLRSLISSEQLSADLLSLRLAGYTVSWISIGGNYGVDDSPKEISLKDERSVHARYVLTKSGIEGTRITISPISTTDSNEYTTVRVFGFKSP